MPANIYEHLPVLNDSVIPSETVRCVEKVTDSSSAKTNATCKTSVSDKSSGFVKQTTDDKKTECDKSTVMITKVHKTVEDLTRTEDEPETVLPAGIDCDLSVEQNVDEESDDNVSVWSQTESLRIDESANTKDNLSSPHVSSYILSNFAL